MTRHTFPGHTGATSVAIGWDRPLRTFYVTVFKPDPEAEGEETSFIWKGTNEKELETAAAAIAIAKPWADLPEDLARTLEVDRLKTIGVRDGPAQDAARRWRGRQPD